MQTEPKAETNTSPPPLLVPGSQPLSLAQHWSWGHMYPPRLLLPAPCQGGAVLGTSALGSRDVPSPRQLHTWPSRAGWQGEVVVQTTHSTPHLLLTTTPAPISGYLPWDLQPSACLGHTHSLVGPQRAPSSHSTSRDPPRGHAVWGPKCLAEPRAPNCSTWGTL